MASFGMRQGALELGPETWVQIQLEKQGDRIELQTVACPACGDPIVIVHDATVGESARADQASVVLLQIGERSDGTPIVARPSNGLTLHRCTTTAMGGTTS
jgi:hypothetical protein